MSNWPNIQEYRNFEAKFFNSSVAYDELNGPTVNGEGESIRSELIDFDELTASRNEKFTDLGESKTVRCVIKNVFDEKFARGDGAPVNHRDGQKTMSLSSTLPEIKDNAVAGSGSATDRLSVADSKRLENHFKWKKQKEEEYMQKKLAEKLAQQKRKEEELRLEKLKKQKEKEREEKIREWQEQKAREKEGKKREKIVMKVLEEELKEAIPVIDKEKLIEDWVKLKDKQRQIDAEKKAEMLKREEENRALRQSLAALSYRQWKEKIKGKNMALPKNGYQIFGPKPVPVVKEDWNHNFISNSPRQRVIGVVGSKSSTTTNITSRSFSYQNEMKDLENLSLNIGRKKAELKTRSPSFYHLKNIKSGLDLTRNATVPFKGIQPENYFLKKNSLRNLKETASTNTQNYNDTDLDMSARWSASLLPEDEVTSYQNSSYDLSVSPSRRLEGEKKVGKKLDLYINSSLYDTDNSFPIKLHKSSISAKNLRPKENDKVLERKSSVERESRIKSASKKTFAPALKRAESFKSRNEMNRQCGGSIQIKSKNVSEENKRTVQVQPSPSKKNKIARKSKSYDRPAAKVTNEIAKGKIGGGLSSVKQPVGRKSANGFESKPAKSPTCPKRRMRKLTKSNSADGADKRKSNGNNVKVVDEIRSSEAASKKPKKKTPKLYSYGDSPYNVKKTPSKSMDKTKNNCKKKPTNKDGREEANDKNERQWSSKKTSS